MEELRIEQDHLIQTDHELVLPSEALAEFDDVDIIDGQHQTTQNNLLAYHGIKAGDIGLLFPSDTIGEVVDDIEYCKLPHSPPQLVGMASLRGQIIPVFNLHLLLDIPEPKNKTPRVLVIGEGKTAIGMTVYQLPEKVQLESTQKLTMLPPMPAAIEHFVSACYRTDKVWFDWDIFRFFALQGESISC